MRIIAALFVALGLAATACGDSSDSIQRENPSPTLSEDHIRSILVHLYVGNHRSTKANARVDLRAWPGATVYVPYKALSVTAIWLNDSYAIYRNVIKMLQGIEVPLSGYEFDNAPLFVREVYIELRALVVNGVRYSGEIIMRCELSANYRNASTFSCTSD